MSSSQLPLAPAPKPKPEGIPMWVALSVLLVLSIIVVTAIGGFWYYAHSDKLKMQRELEAAQAATTRAELALKQASQNAGLAVARTHQEELQVEARAATNMLTRLLVEAAKLQSDATTLKTSDPGRQVALFPDLVAQARHFYDTDLRELAPRENIVMKLEGARRIELQLVDAAGTTYEPTTEVMTTLQGFKAWGEPALQKAAQLRQILSTLVSESKVKVTNATVTANSPTLETAMAKLAQAETEAAQRLLAQNSSGAKMDAAKIAADAEARQIISEAERKRNEVNAKVGEEADKQSRDLALRVAQGKVADTKTQVAVQDAADEARKVQLRKKASDPLIQAKLAPFITPGYIQVYQTSYDKKPFSYKELQSFGALNPDFDGLDRLVAVATAANDKVRPHWKFNKKFYRTRPNDLEMVKEAQQLLIELGPVLVEMGLLQP
jgi:hypothetical protein